MRVRTNVLAIIITLVVLIAAPSRAFADLTVLHSFDGNPGSHPLVSNGEHLFGVTNSSIYRFGLVDSRFERIRVSPGMNDLNPSTLGVADSALFGIRSKMRLEPSGPRGQFVYVYNNLQLISLNTDGTNLRVLSDFSPPGISLPRLVAPLIVAEGAVYNLLSEGFGPAPYILKVNRDGTGYQYLERLLDYGHDRATAPILVDSTLFGVSRPDPVYGSTGRLWRMNTDGSNFQILHAFLDEQGEGFQPTSVAVDGSTIYGGALHYGSLYRVNTDGTGFQVLREFDLGGVESLFFHESTLFGVAIIDGPEDWTRVIFRINTDGTSYEQLHRFPDNKWTATLTLVGDTLYGTTNLGGNFDRGTIFALPIPEPTSLALAFVGILAACVAFRRRALTSKASGVM